jgi:hypothetical protein
VTSRNPVGVLIRNESHWILVKYRQRMVKEYGVFQTNQENGKRKNGL